jgi:hypothetical protein
VVKKPNGWIGVDLDGTLAMHHDNWTYPDIGEPIWPMVERVKRWLAEGKDVRIVTARVHPMFGSFALEANYDAIHNWTAELFGEPLAVTCRKDPRMVELWDDRAVQVERNTGRRIDGND